MEPNLQFPADLETFTEETLNRKLIFLCNVLSVLYTFNSRPVFTGIAIKYIYFIWFFKNTFNVRLLLFYYDFQGLQGDFYIKWLKALVLIFFKAIKAGMNINRILKLYITAKICQNTSFLFSIFPCKDEIYQTRCFIKFKFLWLKIRRYYFSNFFKNYVKLVCGYCFT